MPPPSRRRWHRRRFARPRISEWRATIIVATRPPVRASWNLGSPPGSPRSRRRQSFTSRLRLRRFGMHRRPRGRGIPGHGVARGGGLGGRVAASSAGLLCMTLVSPRSPASRRSVKNGAPERSRTPNPQIRSLVLYPVELRAHCRFGTPPGWVSQSSGRPYGRGVRSYRPPFRKPPRRPACLAGLDHAGPTRQASASGLAQFVPGPIRAHSNSADPRGWGRGNPRRRSLPRRRLTCARQYSCRSG